MIDIFALIVSHGLLVLVILRLFKVRDPALPPLPARKIVVRGKPRA